MEICTTPTRASQANVNTNSFSKIPLRRPVSAATARDRSRRISHGSDTGDRPGTAGAGAGGAARRSLMYNSNTSINSDASQTLASHTRSARGSTTATPRLFTPSSNSGSSQHRSINNNICQSANHRIRIDHKWPFTSQEDHGVHGEAAQEVAVHQRL